MQNQQRYKYWCYSCEGQFTINQQTGQCPNCNTSAIEVIDSQGESESPSNFQVYKIQNLPQNQTQNSSSHSNYQHFPQIPFMSFNNGNEMSLTISFDNLNHPLHFNPLQPLSLFSNMLRTGPGSIDFQTIFNRMMGESNLIPASQAQINQLERVNIVPQCSICQNIQESLVQTPETKGYKLKCNHIFHQSCLTPWLEKTNTCPCCRKSI